MTSCLLLQTIFTELINYFHTLRITILSGNLPATFTGVTEDDIRYRFSNYTAVTAPAGYCQFATKLDACMGSWNMGIQQGPWGSAELGIKLTEDPLSQGAKVTGKRVDGRIRKAQACTPRPSAECKFCTLQPQPCMYWGPWSIFTPTRSAVHCV